MKKLLLFIISLILLVSCGTVQTAQRSVPIDRTVPIVLICEEHACDMDGKLRLNFFENDFNIISDEYAKELVAQGQKVYKIDAVLNAYFDIFYWCVTMFDARISDYKTGEIISISHFKGDKKPSLVAKEYVQSLYKNSY